ncbi:transcription termination/antitermination NusG family protein [Bradyrhizobium sp. HKCCYLRH2060]|uniref:transcription termination/antitermination NusG family protein n=1 Tax=Bradyrhizobium sp. HKCCYLRH2060 TaxID=3420743 RepID=UPI003EBB5A65
MLVTSKGNLSEVRVKVGQVVDFVDPHPVDPRMAEIPAGVSASWHVLETHPNQEQIAAGHLIGRRFGIYVPETEHDIIRRGRKLHVTRPMFPGYVFVFVWDIGRHWNRIRSIPGVAHIMTMTTEDGFTRPLVMPDGLIDYIRTVENSERPLIAMADIVGGKRRRNEKRKGRKHQAETPDIMVGDVLTWRCWDAFRDGLMSIDSEQRNQTLLAALSLPSQPTLGNGV